MSPLLTPDQAAVQLGISSRQVRDLTADGSLPFIDVGRGKRAARRYDPLDIEVFKAERRRVICPSSKDPAPRRTVMTSASKVFDIQEALLQRQKEKLKNSRNESAKKHK